MDEGGSGPVVGGADGIWAAAAVGELVDRVASDYAVRPSAGEAERARSEYDRWRGRVFEDDELYPTHIATFLEWFVIERVAAAGLTPIVSALLAGEVDPPAAQLARALACSHRSLFEVREVRAGALWLTDLIGGGRWRCGGVGAPAEPLLLVSPGELMEARLVPWRGGIALGPVALFHPAGARRAIHELLARRRAAGRLDGAVLGLLAEMYLRWGRVRNIAVERIYSE